MTATGEAKRGVGRPKGSKNSLTQRAREHAAATGDLPHEWLLRVMRGEEFEEKHVNIKTNKVTSVKRYPTLLERIDAAKAAAPYYAPRLAVQQLTSDDNKIKEMMGNASARMLAKLDEVLSEGVQDDDNGKNPD